MTFHILLLYTEITAAVETKLFSTIKKRGIFKNNFLLSLEGELMILCKMSGKSAKLLSGPNKYYSEDLQLSGQILPLIMPTKDRILDKAQKYKRLKKEKI